MEIITGKAFRDSLHSGRTVYGTLVTSSSPRMFDTITALGPDFVFLCTEHVFYNPDSLGWMCRAYRAAGIAPLVRILKPDPFLATQALDSGASAILTPYTEDPEQVMELIGAVRCRPLKGRKLRDILSGKEKPGKELKKYLLSYNRNNSLLLNIESPEGIRNLEKFLSIEVLEEPAVDGIVIGPHDLSVSYDLPEKFDNAEFLDLSCNIIRKARMNNVAAGGHNGSRGSIFLQKKWAEAGATIIVHSSDLFLFADKYQEEINLIRSIRGDRRDISLGGESI